MKKIIVTGAGGFIGRKIVFELSKNLKNSIIAIDNNERGQLKSIKKIKNVKKVFLDIRNKNSIEKYFKNCDICFHLAAINGTKNFYLKPELVLDVGVKGTINVLEAAMKYNIKKFVYFSSSEAYQKPFKIPTKEDEGLKVPDVFNPRFSYGGSKIIGELLTINYLRKTNIKYFILRPHNVYGPNMGNDHVIPELIKKIKKKSKFLKIIGNGKDSRSFIYIDDAVNAILNVVNNGEYNKIYNIGSDDEYKVSDIVKLLSVILKKEINIIKGPKHEGSVTRRVPDCSNLKKLNHRNKVKFKDGLDKMVNFYFNND
jgi:nucleoside-diphosphate-sugar epimerase